MALVIIAVVLLILILYVIWENNNPETSHYSVKIPFITDSLKGTKILQLSDLHFGKGNQSLSKVVQMIKAESPDMIVVTGDIVQAGLEEFPEETVKEFAQTLNAIAPTYAVTGNHDFLYVAKGKWQTALASAGVQVLLDKAEWVPVKDSGIVLMGLAEKGNMKETPRPLLQNLYLSEGMRDCPKILLAHHAEYYEEYLDDRTKAPDLILAGHTHGGQMRLPFVGGVYAPGQGAFPRYDYGYFYTNTEPARRMIVNRGIGNSSFPFRVFNRPEVVVVTLE